MIQTYKRHNKVLKKPAWYKSDPEKECKEVERFLDNPIAYPPSEYQTYLPFFQRYIRQSHHKKGYREGPVWLEEAMKVLKSIENWTDQQAEEYPWQPGMLSFILGKISGLNIKNFPNIKVDMIKEGREVGRWGELARFAQLSHNIDKYFYNYEKNDFWKGYRESYKSQNPQSPLHESYYDYQHDTCFYTLGHIYGYPHIPHEKYTMSLPYETIEKMWPSEAEKIMLAVSHQMAGQNKEWLTHQHTKQLWVLMEPLWNHYAVQYWEWSDYIVDALASWIAYDSEVFMHIPSYVWDTAPVHLIMKHMDAKEFFHIDDDIKAYISVLPELTVMQWEQAKATAHQEEMVWI